MEIVSGFRIIFIPWMELNVKPTIPLLKIRNVPINTKKIKTTNFQKTKSGHNFLLIENRISVSDSEQSPGVYLRDDPVFGTQLQNHSELRVPTAERAAFYLDAALESRSVKEQRDSHLLYTLHVYQYSVAGKGGGTYRTKILRF